MLRQQLLRTSRLLARLNSLNASRPFSATARRKAEVELTIGVYLSACCSIMLLTGAADGKKVSIEGMQSSIPARQPLI
jgi:hypothetical protein